MTPQLVVGPVPEAGAGLVTRFSEIVNISEA